MLIESLVLSVYFIILYSIVGLLGLGNSSTQQPRQPQQPQQPQIKMVGSFLVIALGKVELFGKYSVFLSLKNKQILMHPLNKLSSMLKPK